MQSAWRRTEQLSDENEEEEEEGKKKKKRALQSKAIRTPS